QGSLGREGAAGLACCWAGTARLPGAACFGFCFSDVFAGLPGIRNLWPHSGQAATPPALESSMPSFFSHLGHCTRIMDDTCSGWAANRRADALHSLTDQSRENQS